jgi:hypothetical protein
VIAMTLVNVRWLLERNGEITITWPAGRIKAAELSEALASAAWHKHAGGRPPASRPVSSIVSLYGFLP